MAIVIRQRRHMALDAVDGRGEQIEMLAGSHRNLGAGHRRHVPAPQAGAERNGVAPNRAAVGLDAGDLIALSENAGDSGVFVDIRAAGSRPLDQRGAQIRRADATVVGRPHGADAIVRVHQRPAHLCLLHRNGLGADAEQVRPRLLASDMNKPILAGGDRRCSRVVGRRPRDQRRAPCGKPCGSPGRDACVAHTPAIEGCDPDLARERLRIEPEPRRRRLIALGLLTRLLSTHGIEPIPVGGGALEFYTAGDCATNMDPALPAAAEVDDAFAALGFEEEGRYWYHGEFDLLFEAPTPAGLPGEDAPRTEIEIAELRVVIIGIEALLIDRLRAWVHWKSDEDGRWTRRLALLYPDRIDWGYVRQRTRDVSEEADALSRVEREVRTG